jgi:phosphoribosyl 1,2-cyclic phosphodiesterase
MHTVKFGGNTSCVQAQIGERLFIFDAGSGIVNLGQYLLKREKRICAEIFISHTHWDHIQGFPFFGPAFVKDNSFILYGQGKMNQTFANLMRGQMEYAHFPVSLEQMGAMMDFREVDSGHDIDLGDGISVKTINNNHPGGSISYRLEYGGKSCCYVTDNEHYEELDLGICNFIKGTDLLIMDANYTDEEYRGTAGCFPKVGWGHSTWQEVVRLFKTAGGGKLALFHHDPFHADSDMEAIELQARELYPECFAAREGMSITL